MKHGLLTIVLLSASLAASCYSADEALVKSAGNLQKKGTFAGASSSGKGQLAEDASSKKPVATATYFLDIETASGAKPCEGQITMDIMGDFTFGLRDSKATCASLTLDIAKLLNGQLKGAASSVGLDKLSSDGQILSIAEIAGATFDPPRPFIVGPIVQDSSKFAGLSRVTPSTVTVAKPESGQPLKAEGSFTTKVLEVDGFYQNKYLTKGFDKVMHWTMETEGFQGVPSKYGLLFKKWEWRWNTRPIMIPKIIITLEGVNGFIEGKSADSLAELVGEVTITLTVKEYNFSGG